MFNVYFLLWYVWVLQYSNIHNGTFLPISFIKMPLIQLLTENNFMFILNASLSLSIFPHKINRKVLMLLFHKYFHNSSFFYLVMTSLLSACILRTITEILIFPLTFEVFHLFYCLNIKAIKIL